MHDRPRAARTSGGLLKDTIRLYRTGFVASVPLSLLGAALLTLAGNLGSTQPPTSSPDSLDSLDSLDLNSVTDVSQLFAGYFSIAALKADAVLCVIFLIFCSAIMVQFNALVAGTDRVPWWPALQAALRAMPATILAGVVWILVTGICLWLLVIPGISAAWVLLLLIPSIYFSGRWQFWLPAVLAERAGAIDSLRHSWNVTQSQWWRSASALTVALIVIGVLEMLADAMVAAMSAPTGDVHLELSLVLSGSQLLRWLCNAALLPMLPASLIAIYYDLKSERSRRQEVLGD